MWTNLTDNHLTVQFLHRMAAYALLGVALLHALDCVRERSGRYRAGAVTVAAVLLLQAMLGIATLLWHVPTLLALAHQLVAMLALILATAQARTVMAARTAAGERIRDARRFAAQPLHAAARE
jgi:cytochrome c oxidase assembly protein subunit 15